MAKKSKVPAEIRTGKVRRVNLSDLKPAIYNPRTITDLAKDGLKESLTKFGVLNLIIWNERSGNVVGGHQRLKVLQEQGEKDADVLVVNLDDKEEMALNIALNNHAIQGDFSAEALEVLKKTEVNLGEMFDKLQLKPIMDKLEKKIARSKKKESPLDNDFQEMPKIEEKATEVIVVCPSCSSKWRMRDNVVTLDNSKKDVPV